jgi:hypothetical protein
MMIAFVVPTLSQRTRKDGAPGLGLFLASGDQGRDYGCSGRR